MWQKQSVKVYGGGGMLLALSVNGVFELGLKLKSPVTDEALYYRIL